MPESVPQGRFGGKGGEAVATLGGGLEIGYDTGTAETMSEGAPRGPQVQFDPAIVARRVAWRLPRPIGLIALVGLGATAVIGRVGAASRPAMASQGGEAQPLEARVACSPDRPAVPPHASVTVRAWSPDQSARYQWTVTAGRVTATGAQIAWDLAGVSSGVHAAVVRLAESSGASPECVVRVAVRPEPQETVAWLLVSGRSETRGYGLYSYLLLGARPSAATRTRYTSVLDTVWRLVPDLVSLEQYLGPQAMNVTYIPLVRAPTTTVTTEWLLDQYDYASARTVLRVLKGAHRDGPYILSLLKPVSGAEGCCGTLAGPYLFQDLSAVPPDLAAAWVKEFLNQAAQERVWEPRTGAGLALRLRLTVGIAAAGMPEVRQALAGRLAWVK